MILDAAVIAFIGFWVWRGLRRGLVIWIVNALGFVLAVGAAVYGYRGLARPLRAAGFSETIAALAAALIIFLAVSAGAWFGARALSRLVRLTRWGLIDRAGGAAAAGSWALAWVSAVLLAISVVPVPEAVGEQFESSTLGRGIVEAAPNFVETFARTDYRRLLATFLPDGGEPVLLAATVDYRRVAEVERELFDLTNAERRAHGVAALRWDEAVARVARAHAEDMYGRGFFSHTSPDGRGLRDRLRSGGVQFVVMGENLALAPTVAVAHNQLMASAEHRKHILGESFARVGIGVMLGRQGYVAVQEFVG